MDGGGDGGDGDDGGDDNGDVGDGVDIGVDRRKKLLPTLLCPNVPALRLVVLFQVFPMLPLMAFSMSPCTLLQVFLLQCHHSVAESLYNLSMINVAGGERNPGKFQELLPPRFHKPPSCSQGDMMIPNCTSSM